MRSPWPYPRGHRCPVSVAEAYFVDAIEAWRAALSLDTDHASCGHSIGGYIAAAYAERHPERVRKLVLASPAGVPHPPEGLAEVHAKAPRVLKLVRSLVRRGWSPMLLTSDLGMGRRLLSNYMSRRFGDEQPWIANPLLLNYLLGIWCRSPKSAGGYMVQALMAVGGIPKGSQGEFAYARHPLAERLLALVKIVPRVSLIYGEFDWINWRNGADVALAQQAQPGGRRGGRAHRRVAGGAGHTSAHDRQPSRLCRRSPLGHPGRGQARRRSAPDPDGTTALTQRFSSVSPV